MILGFDADDTLWHCEDEFQASHRAFEQLLSDFGDPEAINEELFGIERRNMDRYGFGVKAFTLSMIECAVAVSGGKAGGETIGAIVELGHALLDRPTELIDGVEEVLDELESHTKILITKGDLYHQHSRIEASGLADRFRATEIVAHKTPQSYAQVLTRHGIDPSEFIMVGNSVPSDVLPVIELGGRGIHVPYPVTWAFEQHDDDHDAPQLSDLRELPNLLTEWGLH